MRQAACIDILNMEMYKISYVKALLKSARNRNIIRLYINSQTDMTYLTLNRKQLRRLHRTNDNNLL